MLKYNLELFKTLISNFAYIHSKRRKLGIFILFPKYQFIYPNKVNLPPIRQFPSFKAQENLKIYFWGKIHFVLSLLARDISNHSYVPNTPLTQALKPLRSDRFLALTEKERAFLENCPFMSSNIRDKDISE